MTFPTQSHEIDIDPAETQEWVDALVSTKKVAGVERAQHILNKLEETARVEGLLTGEQLFSSYRNSIPVERQSAYPGNLEIENRLTSIIRWNALATVVRANEASAPVKLPFIPEDPRVIDSTGALALEDIPARMLVLGGGIIGMELGQVYQRFGSEVSVVEMMSQIIPGADKDIVAPLMKRVSSRCKEILLGTRVTAVEATEDGLIVSFEKDGETRQV